nr:MAG TPA: 3-phosphoinositide-dependent protein kinase 1 [Caudoviricetes sp.]
MFFHFLFLPVYGRIEKQYIQDGLNLLNFVYICRCVNPWKRPNLKGVHVFLFVLVHVFFN